MPAAGVPSSPPEKSPPLSLDLETVRKIAFLARIRVDDAELATLAGELSAILGWVEQLSAVDTADVAPMASVADAQLPLRADIACETDPPAVVLANAPGSIDDFFAVPKVVE